MKKSTAPRPRPNWNDGSLDLGAKYSAVDVVIDNAIAELAKVRRAHHAIAGKQQRPDSRQGGNDVG